jgi:phage terminase large subunit-like protein
MKTISPTTWARWKRRPCDFVEECLHDPEVGKPFRLLDVERRFMERAFETDADGRMLFPELVYGAPKKSGKTAFGALFMLTMVLLYGGRFSEAYAAANDEEQAVGRVFAAARRIVECSPLLAPVSGEQRTTEITRDKITFPQFSDASITAIASDYAGAAGSNPSITVFDEAWAYTSERSRRLFDESVPPPTRKMACRLVVTYAGFEGESTLLEELYRRGLQQPEVGPGLHAGDGILMSWQHGPIAPWQTESWLEQMRRQLRANQFARMIENRFVTSESSFVDLDSWDACIHPDLTPMISQPMLPIWVGVDASHKHDSTAIVAVHWDAQTQKVRLITHRVFQPSPDDPLDFEETIEATLNELKSRFKVQKVLCDPWQLQAVMQRLQRAGIPIEEYLQTQSNLTAVGQGLFELVQGRNLILYPDADMRLAVSRAVAVETSRGWRISKATASHKIDVVVALAMACHAAVSRGEGNRVQWHFGSEAINNWLSAVRAGETPRSADQFIADYDADMRRKAFVSPNAADPVTVETRRRWLDPL